jgi:hypothetical protein
MGKAYANRLSQSDRPEGDFYPTPRSLVWAVYPVLYEEFDRSSIILEPCSGDGAVSDELHRAGYQVHTNDLFRGGFDYLEHNCSYRYIVTNPPFSMWDEFAEKAKSECEKVLLIGRLNYFGTASRLQSGMWENLKAVYCFNRYVDYRTEPRLDGLFNVGAMATGWFLWEANYTGDPALRFLDINPYAKLGNKKN